MGPVLRRSVAVLSELSRRVDIVSHPPWVGMRACAYPLQPSTGVPPPVPSRLFKFL
jgi:hypothetical protein